MFVSELSGYSLFDSVENKQTGDLETRTVGNCIKLADNKLICKTINNMMNLLLNIDIDRLL